MAPRGRRRALGLALAASAAAQGWTGEFRGAHRGFALVRDPPNDLPPHAPVVDTRRKWYKRWLADGGTEAKWQAMDEFQRMWAKVEKNAQLKGLPPGLKRGAIGRKGKPMKPDRRTFVIITVQRTGSTWLAEELDRHPCIRCSKELFLNTKAGQTDERSPVEFNWTGAGKFAALAGLVNRNIHANDSLAAAERVDVRSERNRYRCARFDDDAERRLISRHFKEMTCGFKWMVTQKVAFYWDLWFRRMAAGGAGARKPSRRAPRRDPRRASTRPSSAGRGPRHRPDLPEARERPEGVGVPRG